MSAEKLRRLRELIAKYYEARDAVERELEKPVELGRLSLEKMGKEAKEELEYYHYEVEEYPWRYLVVAAGNRKIRLGKIQLEDLLRDIIEYTSRPEVYEKRVEMIRLVNEQLHKEAREALEQLKLIMKLIRQTLGDPAEVARQAMCSS